MSPQLPSGAVQGSSTATDPPAFPLGTAPVRFRGRIVALDATTVRSGIEAPELERRLLEMGFVEGAIVEVRHQGPFGRDPIAVRVNGATIALRRGEAAAVLVLPADPGA